MTNLPKDSQVASVRKILYFAPGILCDTLNRRFRTLELPRISLEIVDISRFAESTALNELIERFLVHVPDEGSPIVLIGNQGYFGEQFIPKCKEKNPDTIVVMCSFSPERLAGVDFFLRKSESTLFKDLAWFVSECGELLKKDSVSRAPLFRTYQELMSAKEWSRPLPKKSAEEIAAYQDSISL